MGRVSIDSKYGLPRVVSGRKFMNQRINESTNQRINESTTEFVTTLGGWAGFVYSSIRSLILRR